MDHATKVLFNRSSCSGETGSESMDEVGWNVNETAVHLGARRDRAAAERRANASHV